MPSILSARDAMALRARWIDTATWSTRQVVGISVSSGLALLFLLPALVILFFRCRKRRMNKKRSLRAHRISAFESREVKASSPQSRHNTLPFSSRDSWGPLPSDEDLNAHYYLHGSDDFLEDQEHGKPRKSGIFAWPLPRNKASRKRATLKKIRPSHLPAILESPISPASEPWNKSAPEKSNVEVPPGTAGTTSVLKQDGAHNGHGSLSRSPEFDVLPSFAARARLPPTHAEPLCPPADQLAKSYSSPSMFGGNLDDPFWSWPNTNYELKRQSKSASVWRYSPSIAPKDPPPRIPSRSECRRPNTLQRTSSDDTVSSANTSCSSILNLSTPQMRTMADFSQRHPEMRLGAQVRQDENDLRDTLMPLRPPPTGRTKVSTPSRHLVSSHGFFSHTDKNAVDEPKPSKQALEPFGKNTAVPQRQKQDDPQAVGEEPSAKPNPKSKAVSFFSRTPSRRKSKTKVSASGSPEERPKSNALSSKSGSESDLYSSQSSSHSLTDGSTPNDYQDSNGTIRPSALKGSPNAKKHHKRSNGVRISIQPDLIPSLSSNPSNSDMFDIAEEPSESPVEKAESETGRCRPPSCSEFNPDIHLGKNSFENSLAPSSPTFSSLQHHFEHPTGNEQARSRRSSRSPLRKSNRADSSTRSSVLTVSGFPIPGQSAVESGAQEKDRRQSLRTSKLMTSTKGVPSICIGNTNGILPVQGLPEVDHAKHPAFNDRSVDFVAPLKLHKSTGSLEQSRGRTDVQEAKMPSSLSPPSRSVPTTEIIPATPSPEPSMPSPPSSSTNPMDTKPYWPPPGIKHDSGESRPSGPRAPPAQGIPWTIMQLRRENSDARKSRELQEFREDRRYLYLGREPSPSLSSVAGSVKERGWRNSIMTLSDDKPGQKSNGPATTGGAAEGQKNNDPLTWSIDPAILRATHDAQASQGKLLSANTCRPNGKGTRDSMVNSPVGSLYDGAGFLKA